VKLLILSQWYRPEPDIKVHLLGRELVARGHQVTAITGFPNYPQGRIYPGYHQRLWQIEHTDGVRVVRLPLYADHSRSSTRRSLSYLSFALSASCLGPPLSGAIDAIWVYCAPLTIGIPAQWIGLLRNAPFVFNIHDMWPETVVSSGMMSAGWVVKRLETLAQFIYRRSAAITVVSPGFKLNLIAKGVPADKIQVIPNWADEDLYRPVPRDEALAEQHGLRGRFNVLYGGNIGAAQSMDNVLAAAARLQTDLPVAQFVLIGDGVETERLHQTAKSRGLSNVRFIDRQPQDRMAHFFALADALLVHLKRDPLFEITIPSKTIAYLACGRPIITCTIGDPADVVKDVGAGLACPPEDPTALAQAVCKLYEMPVEQREAMGQAGRAAFLKNYTRAELVDRYEQLLEAVASRKRMKDEGRDAK
jgi:colanic acid biosynthesis glycosyl transferase WcaI